MLHDLGSMQLYFVVLLATLFLACHAWIRDNADPIKVKAKR
jgi:hypothetical protein